MAKVAKLVYVSLVTRIIVDDNADEETIREKAAIKTMEKLTDEPLEHIEKIVDDIECPFDDSLDFYF